MTQPHSVTVTTSAFDAEDEGSNPSEVATRRQFLTGLFGVAVVAALPPMPALPPTYTLEQWQLAVAKVWSDCMFDMLAYGTSATRPCKAFPFIECVPLNELYLPPTIGGLFNE